MISALFSAPWRRRMAVRITAALVCAASVGALPPAAHAQATRVRFTLDWRVDGPGAIALLTEGKGYFKQEKLDVSIDAGAGSGAAVQRIVSGTHDIGFADISSVVEYLASNPSGDKLQAVYVLLERAPSTIFVMKKSGIDTPAGLAGRKLAAPVFDAGRKAWPLFAKANRIDPASVTWLNVDPALRETLMARGEVDGITGFFYTSLLNLEARGVKASDITYFKYADYGVNLYGNVVVASQRMIKENPQAVAAFVRALNRGIKDTVRDPKEGIRHVKQREGIIDPAVEERRLRFFLDNFLATPQVRLTGLGGVDKARLRTNIVQIVDAYGLKRYVSPEEVFNDAFLPADAERKL
jgi:NitT/TauT family transport system substrate-binding protein